MSVPAHTRREVLTRAKNRCEYCGMHQSLQGGTFHLEHVVPESRGGLTSLGNLALSCPSCNLHKSDREEAIDPETQRTVPLFNPRLHRWSEHFHWHEYQSVGRTAIGRATILALDFNHPRRLLIRQAEERFERFPPDEVLE